jgi:hypothetical protein
MKVPRDSWVGFLGNEEKNHFLSFPFFISSFLHFLASSFPHKNPADPGPRLPLKNGWMIKISLPTPIERG